MTRNAPRFGIVLLLVGIFGAGFAARVVFRSQPKAPNDAFLSYWQCADGLTRALAQVKSRDEFVAPHPKIGDPDPDLADSMKDICDRLCEQLIAYKEALANASADDLDELREEHDELVNRVTKAVAELDLRHAESPDILGDDWQDYAEALQP